MDSLDMQVLRNAKAWLQQGFFVRLATVVRTWGSSPRPIGAMLALREDGVLSGSVSGGCIEDDLIERILKEGCGRELPELLSFGVSSEQASRFGLPCGGTIQLLLETHHDDAVIAEMLGRIERQDLFARELQLDTGRNVFRCATLNETVSLNNDRLITVHGPRYRLLIIGAGELSAFLADVAAALDYEVTVCDPRDEHVAAWITNKARLTRAMPDDVVIAMRMDPRTAVVALTHDPKLDDLALMEALKTDAFYVGAIGSRSNNRARRQRLLEFDVTAEQVGRLRGPIGVYIGSKTPYEIAISILADLTAAKNGVNLPSMFDVGFAKAAIESQQCSVADR
jgi:xanthine dehydrogenase accessory factor